MYELVKAGDNTFYVDCPTKVGVWRMSETEAVFIDSGIDKDAGRRLRQLLEQNGWQLRAIVNTHSHADHIGGNQYLQGRTGCDIFANGLETALTRHTLLEPTLVYGGCPFRDLHHKFLHAKDSDAKYTDDPAFPSQLKLIPLPGHSSDMVGIRTPDDVVFLADCVSSQETIEKYGVTFLFDIGRQLQTLDSVEHMEAALFVPAHTDACRDIRPLVSINRAKILEIADKLTELCHTPMMFEEILQSIFTHYQLTMNAMQYVLVGSTIRSYLSWLKDTGRLAVHYDDNRMLWEAK